MGRGTLAIIADVSRGGNVGGLFRMVDVCCRCGGTGRGGCGGGGGGG